MTEKPPASASFSRGSTSPVGLFLLIIVGLLLPLKPVSAFFHPCLRAGPTNFVKANGASAAGKSTKNMVTAPATNQRVRLGMKTRGVRSDWASIPLRQFEQIDTIGSVLGRSLRIEEISPEDWLRELPGFLPSFAARYLLDAWAAAVGRPAFVTSTVAELTGAPARTFLDWASDHVAQFRG